MPAYTDLNRKLIAHKGHLTRAIKMFQDIIQANPLRDTVEKLYLKTEEKFDNVSQIVDELFLLLDSSEKSEIESIVIVDEKLNLDTYYNEFIALKCQIENQYVTFLSSYSEPGLSTEVKKENKITSFIKLTSIDPPSWTGVKADFYSWKRKFIHIMEQAGVVSDVTQLCYLQKQGIMPPEYVRLCIDCTSMAQAWQRLEERVPTEIIKQEVINKLKNMKSLPQISTPGKFRDFANEISMFVRRMEDLHLTEESKSTIVLQTVYEKIDSEIVRRYRSEIKLSNRFGAKVTEDLCSIADFLRSEAVTLELSSCSDYKSKKNLVNSVQENNIGATVQLGPFNTDCGLCPNSKHKLYECPLYLNYSTNKRKDYVRNNLRCFLCLDRKHFAKSCENMKECSLCKGKHHHWSLCIQDTIEVVSAATKVLTNCQYNISPCIQVDVLDINGEQIRATCLLDTGSNTTLVRRGLVNELKLNGYGDFSLQFGTAGGRVHNETSKEYELNIKPLESDEIFTIFALGIKKPCFSMKEIPADVFNENPHLEEVRNNIYMKGGTIDILLGMDYAPLILPEKVVKAPSFPDYSVSAAFTRLGCYLFGGINSTKHSEFHKPYINNFICLEETDFNQYFYGDILGVKPTSLCICTDNQIEESLFIKHVERTTSMNLNGRICVKMPWKPGYPKNLPNNFEKALSLMTKREKQLVKVNKMEEYNKEIEELVHRGVVKRLNYETEHIDVKNGPGWYLNHRMIERPNSNSTKLRLVFDSSMPFKGICLNDTLEKGPNFTTSLLDCLIHWRENYVAISGDIEKMFHQVAISDEDQPYHRFLWRNGNLESEAIVYQWVRLIFGDKPSPDLANFAIRFIAKNNFNKYPEGADVLTKSTYVDDIGSSYDNTPLASQAILEIDAILQTGKFNIKRWNSNSEEIDPNYEEDTHFLGHAWCKSKDVFSIGFQTPHQPEYFTKRNVMGLIARIWDPFGIMLPVSIKYKIGLQYLWQQGFSWDEQLPSDYQVMWKTYYHEIKLIENFQIPRCIKPCMVIGEPQLHAFSDGGEDGYGTCVFMRWETSNGVKISFITAKAFVSPLKKKTIPRLELMGFVAMSRLVENIVSALRIKLHSKYFWTDSSVVLYWVRNDSNKFKSFVSARAQECKDAHPNLCEEMRYIPSGKNPADSLTKPISLSQLTTWHSGPEFLKQSISEWPQSDISDVENHPDESHLELKSSRIVKNLVLNVNLEQDSFEKHLCQ